MSLYMYTCILVLCAISLYTLIKKNLIRSLKILPPFCLLSAMMLGILHNYSTYFDDPLFKLSERACLRLFSLSTTPHVAWRTESRRQSPAVLFQRG